MDFFDEPALLRDLDLVSVFRSKLVLGSKYCSPSFVWAPTAVKSAARSALPSPPSAHLPPRLLAAGVVGSQWQARVQAGGVGDD